jgi:hypothetical protein
VTEGEEAIPVYTGIYDGLTYYRDREVLEEHRANTTYTITTITTRVCITSSFVSHLFVIVK